MALLKETTVTSASRGSSDKYNHHHKRVNTPLGHTLSMVEHPSSTARYLILDCPTESTLPLYIEEFKSLQVSFVVRCCQPTYSSQQLTQNGISVVDIPFKDGGIPPPQVISEWLHVIEQAREKSVRDTHIITIAVHCVAGLGRAPVLVAIALIEQGMAPLDAIEYIRKQRRGAFNKPQIMFLDSYKRKPAINNNSFRMSLSRILGFGPKTVPHPH